MSGKTIKKNSSAPHKVKWLVQALILSGVLNALLMLIFFYFFLRDRPLTASFDFKPLAHSITSHFYEPALNAQCIRTFQNFSYAELVEKLKSTQHIEEGFAERDIALGCLVKDHDLDLKRALNGKMVQEREFSYQCGVEKQKIILYAGLVDRDYQTLSQFIQTEKCPWTSHGVFERLRKQYQEKQNDPILSQAFCQTPEFLALETLFGRSGIPVKKRLLLSLICEGSWDSLEQFVQGQKISQDFSPARRQCFLLDYIVQKSKTAAFLMVLTDRLYAEKRLEDSQICTMLQLLDEKTQETVLFAKELLASPRSDAIHQLAGRRLYEYEGEKFPEPFNRKVALTKFCADDVARAEQQASEKASQKLAQQEILKNLTKEYVLAPPEPDIDQKQIAKKVGVGQLRPKFRDKPPASPSPRLHVIQQGESLWMISRKYKVDLETLMQYNGLKSNLIKPGKTLKIPPMLNS